MVFFSFFFTILLQTLYIHSRKYIIFFSHSKLTIHDVVLYLFFNCRHQFSKLLGRSFTQVLIKEKTTHYSITCHWTINVPIFSCKRTRTTADIKCHELYKLCTMITGLLFDAKEMNTIKSYLTILSNNVIIFKFGFNSTPTCCRITANLSTTLPTNRRPYAIKCLKLKILRYPLPNHRPLLFRRVPRNRRYIYDGGLNSTPVSSGGKTKNYC